MLALPSSRTSPAQQVLPDSSVLRLQPCLVQEDHNLTRQPHH